MLDKQTFSHILLIALLALAACDSNSSDPDDDSDLISGELSAAYDEFDADNVTIMLDGDQVIIESNGLPNHTSPYWSSTNERTINGPHGDNKPPRPPM